MSARICRQRMCRICRAMLGLSAGALLVMTSSAQAAKTETPEKQTLRISRTLRPIPDDQWRDIAGEQIAGKYEILRGDTLSGISKRLFGDSRYWPKIWALNNNLILNPHLILPGNRIAFMPGSGTSLPSVAIESDEPSSEPVETMTDAPREYPGYPRHKRHSQEWRQLPNQPWEASRLEQELARDSEIKVMGDLKKVKSAQTTRETPAFASTDPLEPLGQISSAPYTFTYFRLNDQVLISAGSESFQIGDKYVLSTEPFSLERDEKKRHGYAYRVLGEVKIVGRQGDSWIGQITQTRGFIERGTWVMPPMPRLKKMDPVPAPASITGTFYLDRYASVYLAGQNQFGFVNLGTEDGIQEGMIFESYQQTDGYSGAKLPAPRLYRISNLQVVQVSEQFCTVRVLAGTSEIYEGTQVQLLTDVSNFAQFGAFPYDDEEQPAPVPSEEQPMEAIPEPETAPEPSPSPMAEEVQPADVPPLPEEAPPPAPEGVPSPVPEVIPSPVPEVIPSPVPEVVPSPVPIPEPLPSPTISAPPSPAPNELDALDTADQLGQGEKRELEQLERYKATTSDAIPPAGSSAPLDELPPPETVPPAPPETVPPAPVEAAPPAELTAPGTGSSTPAPAGGETLPPSEPQVVE